MAIPKGPHEAVESWPPATQLVDAISCCHPTWRWLTGMGWSAAVLLAEINKGHELKRSRHAVTSCHMMKRLKSAG